MSDKVQAIKALLQGKSDQEVEVLYNGVEFNYVGYDADSDTAFLFSDEHDIECDIDDTLPKHVLDTILYYL